MGEKLRVVCRRCRRKLGQIDGPPLGHEGNASREQGHRWRCDRCGADYVLNEQTLWRAYAPGGVLELPLIGP